MRIERATVRLHIKPEDIEHYDTYKKCFIELTGNTIKDYADEKGIDALEIKRINNNKILFTEKTTVGFDDRKIIVLDAMIKNHKESLIILNRIISTISDNDKKTLYMTSDSRIDEENKLYIRLNKHRMIKGEYTVTDSGECYKTSFHITTYPKDSVTAIKNFLEYVDNAKEKNG